MSDEMSRFMLPEDLEEELGEELAASGRSFNAVIIEALRLRKVVLEALGVEQAGTDPGDILKALRRSIIIGQEAGTRSGRKSGRGTR